MEYLGLLEGNTAEATGTWNEFAHYNSHHLDERSDLTNYTGNVFTGLPPSSGVGLKVRNFSLENPYKRLEFTLRLLSSEPEFDSWRSLSLEIS